MEIKGVWRSSRYSRPLRLGRCGPMPGISMKMGFLEQGRRPAKGPRARAYKNIFTALKGGFQSIETHLIYSKYL